MPVVFNAVEAEKEELQWLLTSGVLGRSNNLARMLTFICEKHFEGQEDQIKEYTIAVEALGRRSDFDAHVDTIVRVTTHSLRKRLQEIYQNEGSNRPVQIQIPPGHYIPSFIHRDPESSGVVRDSQTMRDTASVPPISTLQTPKVDLLPSRRGWLWILIAVLTAGVILAEVFYARHPAENPATHPASADPNAGAARTAEPAATGDAIRALVGTDRKPYVDHSGRMWTPSPFCKGGSSFTVPPREILGTEDPYLYLGGIRGISHCVFPVKAGHYEVHLLFAETSDLQEATRYVVYSLNGNDPTNLDVVDDAAGDGIATMRVYKGIEPGSDGSIWLSGNWS